MFTAADFKLIQRMCPMDLMRLLNLLDIESDKMNFKIGDEFENYENLDAEIDKKICAKLKSSSLIEGYAKLLDCGMIEFQLNETMNELLKKILDNQEKIKVTKSYTPPNFKCTFKRAKRFTLPTNVLDYVRRATGKKEITSSIIVQKEEFPVSFNTKDKIKKILEEDSQLRNYDIEEIAISVIISSNPRKTDLGYIEINRSTDWDEDIFEILSQVNTIFEKI